MRLALRLLIALLSVTALLAVFFFWLLVPVAGILLYFVVHYAFERRRRRSPLTVRDFRLAHEAKAREAYLRKSAR